MAGAEAAFFIAIISYMKIAYNGDRHRRCGISTSFAALFDAAGMAKAVYSNPVERVTRGGGKPCRQRLTCA